jgi:hypothetical protein
MHQAALLSRKTSFAQKMHIRIPTEAQLLLVPSSAITSHYYVLCHIHCDRLANDAFLSNKVFPVLITPRFLLSSLPTDSISSLPTALTSFLLHCDQVTFLPPTTSHRGHCKPKAVFNTFVY